MGANGDGGVAAANLLLLDPDPRTRPGEPSRDRGRAMALQQYSLTKKWKGCVETKWKACPGTRQKPRRVRHPLFDSFKQKAEEGRPPAQLDFAAGWGGAAPAPRTGFHVFMGKVYIPFQ